MTGVISARFAATVALLAGTIALVGFTARRNPDSLAVSLDQIGSDIGGWKVVQEDTLAPGVLRSLAPTSYLSRTYRKGSMDAGVFIAFYAQQRAGESMHSPKHCLPGSGWEIWKHDSAIVPVNGKSIRINKYSIQNQGSRMLMSYWYQSRMRIVASEYMAKVLLARDTLLTGQTSGSIVRIVLPDVPGAEEETVALASKLIPLVQRSFGYEGTLDSQ